MNTNLLPALPLAIASTLWRGLRWAGGAFWRCYERRQQRCALAELDARQLRDLGLAPDDALRESRKPFWRQ